MKAASVVLIAAFLLLPACSSANAGTGTVHITFAKGGFIFGVGKGSGTLHFQGQNYPLDIGGMSIGTIGLGITKLKGHAHNLRHASDIAGTYTAASVSAAVIGGAKAARLQNSNDMVYLQLEGPQVGLELSATVSGMTISLGRH